MLAALVTLGALVFELFATKPEEDKVPAVKATKPVAA